MENPRIFLASQIWVDSCTFCQINEGGGDPRLDALLFLTPYPFTRSFGDELCADGYQVSILVLSFVELGIEQGAPAPCSLAKLPRLGCNL